MADYDQGGAGPRDIGRVERETAGAGDPSDKAEGATEGLPGIVNDLPEVAPHEWIYLMS